MVTFGVVKARGRAGDVRRGEDKLVYALQKYQSEVMKTSLDVSNSGRGISYCRDGGDEEEIVVDAGEDGKDRSSTEGW